MLRSFLAICCRQFQRQDCSSQQKDKTYQDNTEDINGSFNKIVEDIDQAIEHLVNEQSYYDEQAYSDSTPNISPDEEPMKSF